MSLLSVISNIPGVNSITRGAIQGADDVLPGSPGVTLKNNIANTSTNYQGNPNPSSTTDHAPQAATQTANTSPTQDPADPGAITSGSSSDSSSDGAGTSNPTYQTFMNYLNQLSGAYGSLFGTNGLDAQQAAAQENSDNAYYGDQTDALNQQYAQNMQQLPEMYGARGIASSSYAGDADNYAKNTYNDNAGEIQYNQQNDIAAIQKALQGAQGQGNAQLAAYNQLVNSGALSSMPDYEQAEQLGNIENSQVSAAQQLGSTGANAAFLSNIPAPVQNQGTADLQTQLSALANSPTTSAAQNQIASALVGSSSLTPQQQAAGQAYWQQVSNAT